MATTLRGLFDTRRDAEMTVERLVQEHGIDRADILIAAAGPSNTAGERVAGADAKAGELSSATRSDAKLDGPIEVAVDIEDANKAASVRESITEFGKAA
ncbi:hypothetical protein [Bosea rubneri]|uniref:Uncharacterized protein n=1 Tax=Bosea rubneri TaxID=3075434 RepID=A0ABU3SFZ1_9HYPH|nr:hypothetical protein [Bosea sp. ZW T0_25]MDU0343715.1 hypothetical protein [Bosea sp. ZW T0_25]